MTSDTWKIGKIIEIWKKNQLFVDREYQRGVVWKPEQKKKLIDSILRNFPIPLLILQKDESNYNIIDGQQRIESIVGFYENKLKYINGSWSEFKLLNAAQFPLYFNEQNLWMSKSYHNLETADKQNFLDYKIQVIILENYSNNEIRDIFVRLQSGSPLNFQEKMDSLPGQFNHFILETAGKELVQERNLIQSTGNDIDFSGHEFFTHFVEQPANDRGKVRKLCADIYLLFREFFSENIITGISQVKNESFYLDKLDFSIENPINEYYVDLISELAKIDELHFQNNNEKLKNWEAIHIVLFCSICKTVELENWKDKIGDAFIAFRRLLSANNNEPELKEFKDLTKTDANSTKTIKRRMEIFTNEMLNNMYGQINLFSVIPICICQSDYGKKTKLINKTLNNKDIMLSIPDALSRNLVVNQFYLSESVIDEKEKEGSPTHRVTKIKAYYKDGQTKDFNSPQQLYLDIFPENSEIALNRAGLIFGSRDGRPRVNETFWRFINKLDFKMNSRKYSIERNDFDDYLEERYR